jgi:hypothetical protein
MKCDLLVVDLVRLSAETRWRIEALKDGGHTHADRQRKDKCHAEPRVVVPQAFL